MLLSYRQDTLFAIFPIHTKEERKEFNDKINKYYSKEHPSSTNWKFNINNVYIYIDYSTD